jgi:hypothetical protein
VQVVCGGGEQVDGFADVAPGGRYADLESAGQAGQCVAVAQVGQGEQGLPAGFQAPPSGSALGAVGSDKAGEVVQTGGGQRNRGRVRQHSEAPDGGIGSWSTAVLPGASPYVHIRPEALAACAVTMKKAHYSNMLRIGPILSRVSAILPSAIALRTINTRWIVCYLQCSGVYSKVFN